MKHALATCRNLRSQDDLRRRAANDGALPRGPIRSRPGHHRPKRRLARKTRKSRTACADRKGGWSYGENPLGQKARLARRRLEQSVRPAWPFMKRPAPPKNIICTSRSAATPGNLPTNTGSDNQCDDGGWGYYKGMDPDGQHDLRGHFVAGDLRRHAARAGRQRNGDTIDGCPRAVFGRSRKDQQRHRMAADETSRCRPIRPSVGGNTRLWHYYYLYGLERACRLSRAAEDRRA